MLLNVPWRTKFPLIKNHWSPLLMTKMFKKILNSIIVHPEIIFRSRDITLPTKVRLVKAIVFPVVMYGCESWTVEKLNAEELMFLNCGVGEDS